MSKPTLCMIHEAIGTQSAIAKITAASVRIALDAGYKVTVVAKLLDEEFHDRVEWLKLYVPPRLFFVQWTTAELFIRNALGPRRFDIVHAHQPQVAHLSDVFHCHFLTRPAYEKKCLEERKTLRARIVRLQQQGVLYAEDHYYSHWNRHTKMLFCSDLLQSEFSRLYGAPADQRVLTNPFPQIKFADEQERLSARQELVGDYSGPILGYLGGVQERKGYQRIIDSLATPSNVEPSRRPFLLFGGPYSDGFAAPQLSGRFRALGLVSDVNRFYAACDAFIVPSQFEPLGLVAFEAAARGVPVICTREVAALSHVLRFGAGEHWDPGQPLDTLVNDVAARRRQYNDGAERMYLELGLMRYAEKLLGVYEEVLTHQRLKRSVAC